MLLGAFCGQREQDYSGGGLRFISGTTPLSRIRRVDNLASRSSLSLLFFSLFARGGGGLEARQRRSIGAIRQIDSARASSDKIRGIHCDLVRSDWKPKWILP